MLASTLLLAATVASASASGLVPRQDTTAAAASSTSNTSTSISIITGEPSSQPSGQPPVTAPEGSLGLGAICSDTRQCANGAQCWGTTAFTIRRCGNFNAACSIDSQCAYNTCNSGLCNGFIPPSSMNMTATVGPTATASSGYNGTASASPTGVVPFTGTASRVSFGAGIAFAVAIAAWAL